MKSIKRIKIKNKRIVLRMDLDVPIKDGKVVDDTRLKESLKTLNYLKEAKQIIIIGHLGRPKGYDKKLKLDPVAKKLSYLIKHKIKKLDDFVNINIPDDKFIMLENLRFSPEEMKNSAKFSKQLASFGDIYINDAFSVCHRKAASIVGITKLLPSYPGFKLEQEYKVITSLLKKTKKPFTMILGGSKLDKIKILKPLLKKTDCVLIGGAMMFTFLKAQGFEIGKSKLDKENINIAKSILSKKIILPIDVTLNNKKDVNIEKIPKNCKGLDIGKESAEIFSEIIKNSKTIIWNGPMGFFEKIPFNKGSNAIAKAISESNAKSIIGGGDTVFSAKRYLKNFTHYSTAGGAFLELISGKKLPGIKALE